MLRRWFNLWLILSLTAGWWAFPIAAPAQAQGTPTAVDAQIDALIANMTVEERVGQLFLVAFAGNQAPAQSDVARLVQTYRVGGVILLPANGNFSNTGNTPKQVSDLVNQLQQLALNAPEVKSAYPALAYTEAITSAQVISTPVTAPAQPSIARVPLFVAIDQEGDGPPYTRLNNGFTAIPNNMALGATWSDELAQAIGEIAGRELRAAGVNLLFGPSLDVLDTPQPTTSGDLGGRAFGGDPYWVGRLGEAYIRGLHLGSDGHIVTVAKHFPGHGGSDRRADEEVATVNKSLQELYRIELAPFFVVTKASKLGSPSVTDALMSSHIRYRGFQGNIRQLTRPISFDAQNLPALMRLPEFAPWRDAGGLLVSDSLGVPAVKRYYDPQLLTFPYRQIAQEAFLAGNDLLTLSQFALRDVWSEQYENIKATITFFQEKYVGDAAFRERVHQSLRRILRAKLRLYPQFGIWETRAGGNLLENVGKGNEMVVQVARKAVTLIYPGPQELADRLPSPPLPDESLLIFTDARQVTDCSNPEICPPRPAIDPTALEKIMLQLYGPTGSRQVQPERIHSLTFTDLQRYLAAAPTPTVTATITITTPLPATAIPTATAAPTTTVALTSTERLISSANWIIFAMQDANTAASPSADALRQFLRQSEPKLRNKNIVVFAFGAPYYLDTTEISKLTAYYGLYSRMPAFLEIAVRTLFQEITPSAASPVSIAGVNYDLISALEPDPEQVIQVKIGPLPAATKGTPTPVGIAVGGTLRLATSEILDHNGHPVPDGTPVEFRLFYPADAVELPRIRTVTLNGIAEASTVLERTGQLNVTVGAGAATRSTTLQVTIQSGKPALISTVVPTPAPTATPSPSPTSTPTETPAPTFTPTPEPTHTAAPVTTTIAPPRGNRWDELALSLLVLLSLSSVAGVVRGALSHSPASAVRLALWLMIGGLAGYILHVQNVLPAPQSGSLPALWVSPIITLLAAAIAGALSLAIGSASPRSS